MDSIDGLVKAIGPERMGRLRDQLTCQWSVVMEDYHVLAQRESKRTQPLEQFQEELLLSLLWRLHHKVAGRDGYSEVEVYFISLVALPARPWRTESGDEEKEGTASGLTCLEAHLLVDGREVKTFPKWVSHPFYQWGHR